jgi:hypothetical protein
MRPSVTNATNGPGGRPMTRPATGKDPVTGGAGGIYKNRLSQAVDEPGPPYTTGPGRRRGEKEAVAPPFPTSRSLLPTQQLECRPGGVVDFL